MATLKFDELNVLWFNKMELPTAEKLLRIEMAAVFERELNKIFSSQRERADSDKYLLYATVYATIMSSMYIEITNNYFKVCSEHSKQCKGAIRIFPKMDC